MPHYNLIEELTWRGMIQDVMPDTEKQLQEMTTGYVGFDPTAPSLHLGNLIAIMLLVHLQKAGHKPLALVGGATGMIGDPSGKSAERNLLSVEALRANEQSIKTQLEKFLDFDCGENSAEVVNNYDWFKEFSFLDFLRDVGKNLTISYMMAKDSVKSRMETGISFTEFSYQLLQGYDFYHLYKNKNCRLQMGGSDQWGNITSGTELIRRMDSGSAYAMTCPLLTKADGTKMGKTAGGETVWLSADKYSPYKFYQFFINIDDQDIPKLLRYFTLFSKEEIEAMEKEHETNPNALKRILAEDITRRVHSEEDLQKAQEASQLLFGKNTSLEKFENMDDSILTEVFETIDNYSFTKAELEEFGTVIDFLATTLKDKKGDLMSKSEIRKMIKNNGISVSQEKLTKEKSEEKVAFPLIKNQYLLLKKGKSYSVIQVKD